MTLTAEDQRPAAELFFDTAIVADAVVVLGMGMTAATADRLVLVLPAVVLLLSVVSAAEPVGAALLHGGRPPERWLMAVVLPFSLVSVADRPIALVDAAVANVGALSIPFAPAGSDFRRPERGLFVSIGLPRIILLAFIENP